MDIAELDILNEMEFEEAEALNNINHRYDLQLYTEYCSDSVSRKSVLKILHINIRSARKNFESFLTFLETFQLKDLDIIIFGETRNIINTNNYTIPGFQTFSNNSNNNQNDGILVFIRDHINFNIENTILPQSNVTITNITFKVYNVDYSVLTCYRAPSINDNLFLSDLESFLFNLNKKNIDIFLGDTNFNILNPTKPTTNSYISMMSFFGFESYINSYTRVTPESRTCIDHMFIRKNIEMNKLVYDSFVIDTDVTDHFPIYLNISFAQNIITSRKSVEEKTVRTLDEIKFESKLSTIKWNNVIAETDPDLGYQKFIDTFTNTYKECHNTKTLYIPVHKKLKPWITNGIIQSVKHRDKLKKLVVNNKNDNDLLRKYRNYRNNLNKIMQITKHDYYKKLINDNANDMKKIYKIISDATNENKNKTNNDVNILNQNNKPFNNDKEMANFCNDYFINIGLNMAEKIKQPTSGIIMNYPNLINSMALKPVTNTEIIMHINSLKNNSVPGIDGIPSRIIKKYHKYLLDPLVCIINNIFSTGKVPMSFKVSTVTPIFKKGSKTDIANYRPISVISNILKKV